MQTRWPPETPPLDGCGFCPCLGAFGFTWLGKGALMVFREETRALKVRVALRQLLAFFFFFFSFFVFCLFLFLRRSLALLFRLALNSWAEAILLPLSHGSN